MGMGRIRPSTDLRPAQPGPAEEPAPAALVEPALPEVPGPAAVLGVRQGAVPADADEQRHLARGTRQIQL